MIRIQHLSKKFKRFKALDDLSLELKPARYALLGPNGAGKTTLLRCLTGYYKQYEGKIELLSDTTGAAASVGYMPQALDFVDRLTCYENLKLIAYMKGMPEEKHDACIRERLQQVHLIDKGEARYASLSGGMKRRLGIAAAYLGGSKILLLDEPTAGLDPEERMRFSSYLAQDTQGKLLLISTHIVSDVESTCDHLIIMDKGKVLYAGAIQTLIQQYEGLIYQVPQKLWEEAKEPLGSLIRQDILESGPYVRFFSTQAQAACERVRPRLEDVYFCTLHGRTRYEAS